MEPPAKRLRIMQSVEVDESNPEYIAAKARANAKLKNKFESIFAKYQVMPEAMTDEIDIRTGEIVVDRGHLRRLDKEYRRRRKPGQAQGLLDDLIADQLADQLEDDDDEEEEDTRDELAPSQSPEPREQKQGYGNDSTAQFILPAPNISTPGQQVHQVDIPPTTGPATFSAPENNPFSSSAFAHPTTDWTQFLQFPQTPAGQQARNSLMAQINHAVQQAVTPIISSIMFSTAGALPQNTPVMPAPVESATSNQDTPAVRSPAVSEVPLPALSSPVPDKPRFPRRVARAVYITRAGRRGPPQSAAGKDKDTDSQTGVANTNLVNKSLSNLSSPLIPQRESPAESYHLPTPSSIGQNQSTLEERREEAILQSLDDIIASGGHFDEDERDLLSIADGEHTVADLEKQTPADETTIEHEPPKLPTIEPAKDPTKEPTQEPQEDILPSIETETHEPQSEPRIPTPIMANQPTSVPKPDPPTPALPTLKSKTSSSTLRKPRPKPPKFQLDSDSDPNELNPSGDGPLTSKRKRKQPPSCTPPVYTRQPRRRGRPRKSTDTQTTPQQDIPSNPNPQPNTSSDSEKEKRNQNELATTPVKHPITIKRESLTPPYLPPSSSSTHRIIPTIEPTLADAFLRTSSITTTPLSTSQQKHTRHHGPATLSSPICRPRPPSPSCDDASSANTTTTTAVDVTTPAPAPTTNANTETAKKEADHSKLSRSAFLRKVKQAWAKEGRRKSGAGAGGSVFGVMAASSCRKVIRGRNDDGGGQREREEEGEDSEDELAV
ncbi:hypothetical protein DM02DRAFT_672864 [Periconia macrospinosa]|uniref:Uncharacterized protein n=1 Tax=Periconia macrospinosa TaxID=97972 RepID=A0A2V1DME8_9PLEO|nr:hypothetical protein DM02DRAFT_672864 [Periconia macrospinosa]